LLTMEEAAEALGVTVRTIHNYKQAGRLVGQRIGRRWLFTEDNLKDFITGRTASSLPQKPQKKD